MWFFKRFLHLSSLTPLHIQLGPQPAYVRLNDVKAIERLILFQFLQVKHNFCIIGLHLLFCPLVKHLGLQVLVLAMVVVDDILAAGFVSSHCLLNGSLAILLCPPVVLCRPVHYLVMPDALYRHTFPPHVFNIGVLCLIKHLVHEGNRRFHIDRLDLLATIIKPEVSAVFLYHPLQCFCRTSD